MQLLPKLLREFQTLTLSKCKNLNDSNSIFIDCVERNVLNSPSLSGFESDDKQLLHNFLTSRSNNIQITLNQLDEDITIKSQQVDTELKEAQARCQARKSSDSYKDENNKIRIDLICSLETMKPRNDRNKIQLDSSIAKDKFLTEQLADVVKDFLRKRKY